MVLDKSFWNPKHLFKFRVIGSGNVGINAAHVGLFTPLTPIFIEVDFFLREGGLAILAKVDQETHDAAQPPRRGPWS